MPNTVEKYRLDVLSPVTQLFAIMAPARHSVLVLLGFAARFLDPSFDTNIADTLQCACIARRSTGSAGALSTSSECLL
jgi:hypothetical protein